MRPRELELLLLVPWLVLCPATVLGQAPPTPNGNGGTTCFWQCNPGAELDLRFERTFTGSYRYGEPYDVLTIDPAGTGETLADIGVTLRVRVYCDCWGQDMGPIAGLPATGIALYSNSLCGCPFLTAAAPTDSGGWTEFQGTMRGGGCAEQLGLFVDGVYAGVVHIRINSPDTGTASPCQVDASDLSPLSARLGVPASYSICYDYNEDGAVDSGDLSYFASSLRAACP